MTYKTYMRRAIPLLILLLAVLLAYSPALRNGFVWDDTALVLRDPLIRSPLLLAEGFRHFLFLDATASDFYRPLQRAVFTLDYAIAGFNPWVFHFMNILIHAGAAMALYLVGKRLLAGEDDRVIFVRFFTRRHEGTKERESEACAISQMGNRADADSIDVTGIEKEPIANSSEVFLSANGGAKATPEPASKNKHSASCLRAGACPEFVERGTSCENKKVSKLEFASLVAFAVALLWAVHPLHSSAVAYIAGLADPLAALLGFSGLAFLLYGRWTVAGLCLGGALFAKESGVFAILIGLGFAWGMAAKQNAGWPERLRQFARVAVPALLMTALYLSLRATAEHLPAPRPDPVPFLTRLVNGLRAVTEYAGLLIAPTHLRMERDAATITGAAGLAQAIAGALLLAGAVFWFWRSSRAVRACLLAALVAYLPISNLFTLNATIAEHWVYVPSAFLFLAAAATWQRWTPANPRLRIFILFLFGIWLLALGCRTAWRCRDWRDQETFLKATLAGGGNSSRMRGNLASSKLRIGDVEGAIHDYQAALDKSPNQPFAMLGLSSALIVKGDYAQARQWLERCEKSPIVRADALIQHAVLEFKESGQDRVDLLHDAAMVNPHFWPNRKRYIAHLIERGEIEAALRELRAVLDDQPFRAETWEMLGNLGQKTGNRDLAQSAFTEANRRDIHRSNANGR